MPLGGIKGRHSPVVLSGGTASSVSPIGCLHTAETHGNEGFGIILGDACGNESGSEDVEGVTSSTVGIGVFLAAEISDLGDELRLDDLLLGL